MKQDILHAARALRQGKLVVYPTDTLYALGALATSKPAVGMLRRAKGRGRQPLSVVVSSMNMLKRHAFLSSEELKAAKRALPGKYTLLLRPKKALRHLALNGKVGFRIPNNRVCMELSSLVGPIIATSANLSGRKAYTILGIERQLGGTVYAYIDAGRLESKGSTVFDPEYKRVVRKGEGPVGRLFA